MAANNFRHALFCAFITLIISYPIIGFNLEAQGINVTLTGADATTIKAAALTLLFSFTYLWVALNRYNGADGRGLGWFSLFVSITVLPIALQTLWGAQTFWDVWFGLCWAAWSVLWFMFFMLLAMQRPIARATGYMTSVQGVLTGWLPGFLLLNGVLG